MLRQLIASQFKKPSGLIGLFASNVMIKGNKGKYDQMLNYLEVRPGHKLLEIGYGPGIGIKMIADTCDECIIHGIDFSSLMHKKASNYNKKYVEKGNVVLQWGDFLTTSVAGSNYDKIFCLNVVYFWDHLTAAFEKVLMLLKKGGDFHIYMADSATLIEKKAPDSVFNKYSIGDIVESLNTAGFSQVEYSSEKGYYVKAKK